MKCPIITYIGQINVVDACEECLRSSNSDTNPHRTSHKHGLKFTPITFYGERCKHP